MVKAADLGYLSKNLEEIPSKKTKKEEARKRAVLNLTSVEPPERLTLTSLPDSLTEG